MEAESVEPLTKSNYDIRSTEFIGRLVDFQSGQRQRNALRMV